MRKIYSIIAGAVVVAAAAIIVPSLATADSASAPTAPFTAFTTGWSVYSPTPDTGNVTYDPDTATFQLNSLSPQHVQFSIIPNGFNSWENFILWPETGKSITVGTYQSTGITPDATHVGVALDNNCGGTETGIVKVLEITDTAFAASVAFPPSGDCQNGQQTEIRYNSSIGYTALRSTVGSMQWSGDAGQSIAAQTSTFTGRGSEATVFGAATLTNSDNFTISGNTCSGKTIGFGQTCAVSVTPHARYGGFFSGFLKIADNSGPGYQTIGLNLDALEHAKGSYYPIGPIRIVDTRSSSRYGVPKGPLHAGSPVHLNLASAGDIPSVGVGAYVFNVTVTAPTAQGFLTLYPTGSARPTASSVNYAKGWTGANSVTVATGTGDGVDIYASGGSPQLIIDVVGFYASDDSVIRQQCPTNHCNLGGNYVPVQTQRIFDSRYDFGHQVPGGDYVKIPLDYSSALNPNIWAVAVNITAVKPQDTGYVTAWDGTSSLPNASTLNYVKGKTVPNMAIIPVTAVCSVCSPKVTSPSIGVYTTATSDLIVDIVGIFDNGSTANGLRFTPITPKRIVDSRYKTGISGPIGPGATAKITTPTPPLTSDTVALALNVTAVTPTAATFLTAWPAGDSRPTASTLNPSAGQTVPNATIGLLGSGNAFDIYNDKGTTQVLVDVVGTFYLYPPTASADAARSRDEGSAPQLSKNARTPLLVQR